MKIESLNKFTTAGVHFTLSSPLTSSEPQAVSLAEGEVGSKVKDEPREPLHIIISFIIRSERSERLMMGRKVMMMGATRLFPSSCRLESLPIRSSLTPHYARHSSRSGWKERVAWRGMSGWGTNHERTHLPQRRLNGENDWWGSLSSHSFLSSCGQWAPPLSHLTRPSFGSLRGVKVGRFLSDHRAWSSEGRKEGRDGSRILLTAADGMEWVPTSQQNGKDLENLLSAAVTVLCSMPYNQTKTKKLPEISGHKVGITWNWRKVANLWLIFLEVSVQW